MSRIKHYRLKARPPISQELLAYRAGLSAKTVARLENGKHSPRLATLQAIADALEVPVQRLIAKDGA